MMDEQEPTYSERLKAAVGDLVRQFHEEDFGEARPLMLQDVVLIVSYTELDGDVTEEMTLMVDSDIAAWSLIGLLDFHLTATRGRIECHRHNDDQD